MNAKRRTYMTEQSLLRRRFLLIQLVLACFGFMRIAQAVSPPPDGGYAGNNTAEGTNALFSLTTGTDNTANGFQALYHDTTGDTNTANGYKALFNITNGFENTANGFEALFTFTTGPQAAQNTGIGFRALFSLTTGHDDTALGWGAGRNLTANTDTNNIDIGNAGLPGERETIRIGDSNHIHTFIAGINGTPVTGLNVFVNAAGQLGTAPSAARFKDDIKPMDKASESILALNPVTFHYKKEIDPEGLQQFGLVAEEVEKVNPDLVTRDAKDAVYSVRYQAVHAMLLNQFLKEHRKVKEHDTPIAQLKSMLAQQQKEIEMLTADVKEHALQLQKVITQLE